MEQDSPTEEPRVCRQGRWEPLCHHLEKATNSSSRGQRCTQTRAPPHQGETASAPVPGVGPGLETTQTITPARCLTTRPGMGLHSLVQPGQQSLPGQGTEAGREPKVPSLPYAPEQCWSLVAYNRGLSRARGDASHCEPVAAQSHRWLSSAFYLTLPICQMRF